METKKPIKIEMQFMGGTGGIIPKGLVETLKIEIVDGGATYKFNNSKITQEFSERQKKDGVNSKYEARLQKTFCFYPNMSQKEILEHIKSRLTALGAK